MRTIIFRILSGIVGIPMLAVLLAGIVDKSIVELIGMAVIALAFIIFAFFGEKPASAILESYFYFGDVKRSPRDPEDDDSSCQEK